MAKDYYRILGVGRSATQDDIKRAYRRLAHQYHPDKGGGDEERFKEINEAYQVLSDTQKRTQYDQFGQTFESAGPGFGGFSVNFEDLGFGDIFEQFFGGARPRTHARVRRGEDLAVDVTVAFAESAAGSQRDVRHRLYQTCPHCHGNGAEPGTAIVGCATCRGRGTVTGAHSTPFGMFSTSTTCPTCGGEGKQPRTRCRVCRGQGRQLTTRTLTVTIPPGIESGQTIRIRGKGEAPARGGLPGDLFVTVHVTPHPTWRRDGRQVRSRLTVPFIDAILGATVNLETLNGPFTLTIPPGTQPGTQLTIGGAGFPTVGGGTRGDHVVTIDVGLPQKLNREQRELLERYRSTKSRRGLFG